MRFAWLALASTACTTSPPPASPVPPPARSCPAGDDVWVARQDWTGSGPDWDLSLVIEANPRVRVPHDQALRRAGVRQQPQVVTLWAWSDDPEGGEPEVHRCETRRFSLVDEVHGDGAQYRDVGLRLRAPDCELEGFTHGWAALGSFPGCELSVARTVAARLPREGSGWQGAGGETGTIPAVLAGELVAGRQRSPELLWKILGAGRAESRVWEVSTSSVSAPPGTDPCDPAYLLHNERRWLFEQHGQARELTLAPDLELQPQLAPALQGVLMGPGGVEQLLIDDGEYSVALPVDGSRTRSRWHAIYHEEDYAYDESTLAPECGGI